jgi:hypothetical protein
MTMQSVDGTYSRPGKENNAQTILYEIKMLRFAKSDLEAAQAKNDEYVYLEDFLLHYRNLIEFFGKPKGKVGNSDLSIHFPEHIWPDGLPKAGDLDSMRVPGLWKKYDSFQNMESISKYLHHCTKQRVEPRSAWPVNTMYNELRPTIDKFVSTVQPGTS